MTDPKRSASEVLMHGMFGGFLAAIIVIAVQWWIGPINQFYVFLGAVFGFLMGIFYGDKAVDFLKEIWFWS